MHGYVHAASRASHRIRLRLARKLHDGRTAADLRDSLRALVHRRTALGEGISAWGRCAAGMGMGMRAERSPRAGSARAATGGPAQAETESEEAMAADTGAGGAAQGVAHNWDGLMAINRVAGLVLPYTSKPLLDKVLSPAHPQPELLPRSLRWCSRRWWCRPSLRFR